MSAPFTTECRDPDDAENSAGVAVEIPEAGRTSRRGFLMFGALAAAAVASPAVASAQGRGVQTRVPATSRKLPAATVDDPFPMLVPSESVAPPTTWSSPIHRLLRRATYGLSTEDIAAANALGYQGWLNNQINYTRINDSIVNTEVGTRWPHTLKSPEELNTVSASEVVTHLREATIFRATFSRRQLYERMVEFWSDHFNITTDKVGYLKMVDDREVIRRHAMGRFSDLVMASAKSPAMLAYLDQNLSRVGRPNENYARELLELHTVGVDGGYTQTDVVELARVLTGWTLAGQGRFSFVPNSHDWGAKTVMGLQIPAGSVASGQDGLLEGEKVIRMLAAHPSTATFIATKMLRWLLTPEPTQSQISTIASVFKATGGDIKLMVRAILNSSWLPASPAKFKRPFHLLVSGLRANNPSVTSMGTMNSQLSAMGHLGFDWETPDGYPDKIEYWAGNIITRWSFARVLADSPTSSVSIDMTPYVGTASAIVDEINIRFFGGEIAPATRTALIGYLGAATINATRIKETIALAMSSAGFQWY